MQKSQVLGRNSCSSVGFRETHIWVYETTFKLNLLVNPGLVTCCSAVNYKMLTCNCVPLEFATRVRQASGISGLQWSAI